MSEAGITRRGNVRPDQGGCWYCWSPSYVKGKGTELSHGLFFSF